MALILASASPRRAELLQQMGLCFRVMPSEIEEESAVFPYEEWILRLSRAKALAVPAQEGDVVLAADTAVILDHVVMGKPESLQDAERMLRKLSGRMHQVMTGVTVMHQATDFSGGTRVYQDYEMTKVFFRRLSAAEIAAYLSGPEPFDKAGAYGIQGLGALLVEKVEGCYFNIVGLPLVKTMGLLRQCGIRILGEPAGDEKGNQRLPD
ncbi:MAG: Maf family protein [Clostridia bacterium]|jgi:septum formation protein|nr:Maf family protein [Clostridia bacterium]